MEWIGSGQKQSFVGPSTQRKGWKGEKGEGGGDIISYFPA